MKSELDKDERGALLCAQVRRRLMALADEPYREFQSALIPGKDNLLGVRIPLLRKLAKEIVRNEFTLPSQYGCASFIPTCSPTRDVMVTWQQYLDAAQLMDSLKNPDGGADVYYEEILLQGLVIGCAKMPFAELLELIASFVPKIDNWGVCDTFCGTLKATKTHMAEMWEFLADYLALCHQPTAETEYPIRFAVVMLLSYYIKEDYIDRVLSALNSLRHDAYYVKMAVAWALSMCYVKFPEKTMTLFNDNLLDDFTYHKALQKTIESLQVDRETKDVLRKMKRK